MTRIPRFSSAFLGYHYVFALGGAIAYGLLVHLSRYGIVGDLDSATRSSLYLSLAATTGVLLGFAVTAVAVFLSIGPGRGLDLLRKQPSYSYTRKILMGAIYAFALATIFLTLMIVFDTRSHPRTYLEICASFIAILALLRGWALVWLLNRLLRLAVVDAQHLSA